MEAPQRTRAAPRPRRRSAGDGPIQTPRGRKTRVPTHKGRDDGPGTARDGRPRTCGPLHPGPRSPRPLTPGSGGSWRAAPCPARPRSRGAHSWPRAADAEAHSGARTDARRAARRRPRRPGAREGRREPGGGGEPPSGRDGKQPKEATDRKRKWRHAPPSAPHLAPATPPSESLRSRRFRGPARPAASLPARGRRAQGPPLGRGDALVGVEASEGPGRQARAKEVGEASKGPHPEHPAAL